MMKPAIVGRMIAMARSTANSMPRSAMNRRAAVSSPLRHGRNEANPLAKVRSRQSAPTIVVQTQPLPRS